MAEYDDSLFRQFSDLSPSRRRLSSDARDARARLIAQGMKDDTDSIAEMRANRAVNRRRLGRTASATGVGYGNGTPNISFASGRPRDPMFYWKENNLPWDLAKVDELNKLRAFFRLLYISHPIIASAVDIYSKYPILDMEFSSKDDKLEEFYSDLFLDQLNYEEFLIDVGREYWTVGEAWPLGSFNETLGVWEADELIQPEDVRVVRSPFLKDPRFEMKLPEVIRDIIEKRDPPWEYEALMRNYPEMAKFTRQDDMMPVSNILLKQLKFKADTFHPRGLPVWMRAFRAILQEEMLNAAQDAIAERLYTPLTVWKLGASASDLGTSMPWVPTQGELEVFEESIDAALAGDFRMIFTHFATDVENVFGKETMPDFTPDFERLEDRILQAVGLSKTLLNGADAGETYAADALNRDQATQLLSTYQRKLKLLVRDRMLVVAEAQEHYDYEERNGVKYPLMEEILETDPETGEQIIIEQPKLLVPDVHMKTMNMSDETVEQQFKEALRESGVPISIKTRLVNVPIDLDDEIETSREETVALAVANQETRRATYMALRDANLPIDPDLKADFEPKAMETGKGNPQGPDAPQADGADQPVPQVIDTMGLEGPPTAAMAPTPDDLEASESAPDQGGAPAASPGAFPASQPASGGTQKLPTNRWKNRPPESDEMRATMPKPPKQSSLYVDAESGQDIWSPFERGPSVVGMRRYANLDPERPLDEQEA